MLTCAGFSDSAVLQHYLEERIKERAKKHGEFIFGAHRPTTLDIITDLATETKCVMGTMRTVEVKPTPHRFRHTFARIILQRGVSVRDVADLLGNSEQMVRGHYAAWIPERQARLTKILQESFYGRAKAKSHQHA
jgi:integrase